MAVADPEHWCNGVQNGQIFGVGICDKGCSSDGIDSSERAE
jgi:hypothetical protein